MLSYENADSQYSADVTGVDVSVDTAQDTLTDAKEALSEFEIFVGDGTIYSDYDGTIMSVGYEAGDDLSASTSIVTFADTDAVTMTVSVSEEDISEIAIGDEVMIELNAYEDQTFSGEVESIDTSVSSGSSTVSYNVPMMEEVSEETAALQEVVATIDTFESESDKKMKMAKVATILPQNNMIKGRVTDEKGEPLIGASVTYKGTNIGTITNMNGEFSLVKKDDKKRLTAEYIGYDPVEIRVDTSRTMLIAMNENKQTLNEVVVVGYGAKKNKKSTTLGSVVKVEEQAEKEITPQPVIGKRSYQKYLKENLVRPADEKCAQVKGKVVLTFLVNKEGRPFYIKVKESLCESADKEAIRLIQEGPDWIYGNKLAEVTVKFE